MDAHIKERVSRVAFLSSIKAQINEIADNMLNDDNYDFPDTIKDLYNIGDQLDEQAQAERLRNE